MIGNPRCALSEMIQRVCEDPFLDLPATPNWKAVSAVSSRGPSSRQAGYLILRRYATQRVWDDTRLRIHRLS